jgi:hypothetical protein
MCKYWYTVPSGPNIRSDFCPLHLGEGKKNMSKYVLEVKKCGCGTRKYCYFNTREVLAMVRRKHLLEKRRMRTEVLKRGQREIGTEC